MFSRLNHPRFLSSSLDLLFYLHPYPPHTYEGLGIISPIGIILLPFYLGRHTSWCQPPSIFFPLKPPYHLFPVFSSFHPSSVHILLEVILVGGLHSRYLFPLFSYAYSDLSYFGRIYFPISLVGCYKVSQYFSDKISLVYSVSVTIPLSYPPFIFFPHSLSLNPLVFLPYCYSYFTCIFVPFQLLLRISCISCCLATLVKMSS